MAIRDAAGSENHKEALGWTYRTGGIGSVFPLTRPRWLNSVDSLVACFHSAMQRDYEEALAKLEGWAPDPRKGLPYGLFVFISRLVPMVNVDLLISDEQGRILLTWREDEVPGANSPASTLPNSLHQFMPKPTR